MLHFLHTLTFSIQTILAHMSSQKFGLNSAKNRLCEGILASTSASASQNCKKISWVSLPDEKIMDTNDMNMVNIYPGHHTPWWIHHTPLYTMVNIYPGLPTPNRKNSTLKQNKKLSHMWDLVARHLPMTPTAPMGSRQTINMCDSTRTMGSKLFPPREDSSELLPIVLTSP